MKILISPEWIDLIENISTEQKAELLTCIFGYPEKESNLNIWKFIKKQIDRDTHKYQSRCETLNRNRTNRWTTNQSDNDIITEQQQTSDWNISDTIQTPKFSDGNSNSIEKENINEKEKSIENTKAIGNLLKNFSKEHRMDSQTRYEISYDFDFEKIAMRDIVFKDIFYSDKYSGNDLSKAQKSLQNKRYGQRLTLQQLIEWVGQERRFR